MPHCDMRQEQGVQQKTTLKVWNKRWGREVYRLVGGMWEIIPCHYLNICCDKEAVVFCKSCVIVSSICRCITVMGGGMQGTQQQQGQQMEKDPTPTTATSTTNSSMAQTHIKQAEELLHNVVTEPE